MDLFSTYWFLNTKNSRQKSHLFLEAYERHMSKFVGKSPFVFEIGCGYPSTNQPVGANPMGGSLQVFASWLGKGTRVVGIDILEGCKEYESSADGIAIEIGSQSDTQFLSKVVDKYGEPDIITMMGAMLMKI